MCAVEHSDLECIDILLAAGANVDRESQSRSCAGPHRAQGDRQAPARRRSRPAPTLARGASLALRPPGAKRQPAQGVAGGVPSRATSCLRQDESGEDAAAVLGGHDPSRDQRLRGGPVVRPRAARAISGLVRDAVRPVDHLPPGRAHRPDRRGARGLLRPRLLHLQRRVRPRGRRFDRDLRLPGGGLSADRLPHGHAGRPAASTSSARSATSAHERTGRLPSIGWMSSRFEWSGSRSAGRRPAGSTSTAQTLWVRTGSACPVARWSHPPAAKRPTPRTRRAFLLDIDRRLWVREVFAKKTAQTPAAVLEACRRRLKEYDDA